MAIDGERSPLREQADFEDHAVVPIRISPEAKDRAVASVDEAHGEFERSAVLSGQTFRQAPLAESAVSLFATSWAESVSGYQDLLDAVAITVGVVAQALIDADSGLANGAVAGSDPR